MAIGLGNAFYGGMLGQQAAQKYALDQQAEQLRQIQMQQEQRQIAAAQHLAQSVGAPRPYQPLPQTPMPGQPSVPMVHLPARPTPSVGPVTPGAPQSFGTPSGQPSGQPQGQPSGQPQGQPQTSATAPADAGTVMPSPDDPQGFDKMMRFLFSNGVTPDMPMWHQMMSAYEQDRTATLRAKVLSRQMSGAEAKRQLEQERTNLARDQLDYQKKLRADNVVKQYQDSDPTVKALQATKLMITQLRSDIQHGGPAATPQIQTVLTHLEAQSRTTNMLLGAQSGLGNYIDKLWNFANKAVNGEYSVTDKKYILQMLDSLEKDVLTPAENTITSHAEQRISEIGGDPSMAKTIWDIPLGYNVPETTIATPHPDAPIPGTLGTSIQGMRPTNPAALPPSGLPTTSAADDALVRKYLTPGAQ